MLMISNDRRNGNENIPKKFLKQVHTFTENVQLEYSNTSDVFYLTL